ncbi:hypothetical protein AYO45_00455 [Gammaproteobacteria bacterium SCGC AG-212-F23]|nr:hypothetical protein AYO45_00455 [Gammaproteobacteria bacterium SCGC AG-212-F23]
MRKLIIGTICLSVLLVSCASHNKNQNDTQKAFCKEINRRMIFFNGTTSNSSVAQQQRAEMDNLTQDYRNEDCG